VLYPKYLNVTVVFSRRGKKSVDTTGKDFTIYFIIPLNLFYRLTVIVEVYSPGKMPCENDSLFPLVTVVISPSELLAPTGLGKTGPININDKKATIKLVLCLGRSITVLLPLHRIAKLSGPASMMPTKVIPIF
jgi:hypothetical protein